MLLFHTDLYCFILIDTVFNDFCARININCSIVNVLSSMFYRQCSTVNINCSTVNPNPNHNHNPNECLSKMPWTVKSWQRPSQPRVMDKVEVGVKVEGKVWVSNLRPVSEHVKRHLSQSISSAVCELCISYFGAIWELKLKC